MADALSCRAASAAVTACASADARRAPPYTARRLVAKPLRRRNAPTRPPATATAMRKPRAVRCSRLLCGMLCLHEEKQRAVKVLGGCGHLFDQLLIALVLVPHKPAKARLRDVREVVLDRVALGAQPIPQPLTRCLPHAGRSCQKCSYRPRESLLVRLMRPKNVSQRSSLPISLCVHQ